jgi:glycosyltransferase involved in cell wall biosynthesis
MVGRPLTSEAEVEAGVSVVVPAFDEESGVAAQVKAIRRVLSVAGTPHEIVVVDDGSSDRTASEAAAAHARVLRHPVNRGYGAAIKTGIRAAVHDRIVIIDADGTYPADAIPELLAKLATADMVVGARIGPRASIPRIRRPAKLVLGWLANRIAGRKILDLNSGLRAFRRSCIVPYFSLLSDRFSFTTTGTLALLADDYHVVYHVIEYYPRIGRSKIRPRHFMEFVMLVVRMAMLFQPLKVFAPLSVTFLGAGITKIVFDVVALFKRADTPDWSLIYQPAVSTSALLLLLTGLQLLMVGMMADSVLRRLAQQRGPLVPSRAIRAIEEPEVAERPIEGGSSSHVAD